MTGSKLITCRFLRARNAIFKLGNIPFHFSARVRSSFWLDNINRSFFGPLRASSGIDTKIDQKKYLFPRLKRCNSSQGFGAFFGQSCDRDRFLFPYISEFLSLFFSFLILQQFRRGNKCFFWSVFVSMPEEARRVRRSSDLYCPIRENYELPQKNETECFQVLNMASLARRNLQAINLLPDMLW